MRLFRLFRLSSRARRGGTIDAARLGPFRSPTPREAHATARVRSMPRASSRRVCRGRAVPRTRGVRTRPRDRGRFSRTPTWRGIRQVLDALRVAHRSIRWARAPPPALAPPPVAAPGRAPRGPRGASCGTATRDGLWGCAASERSFKKAELPNRHRAPPWKTMTAIQVVWHFSFPPRKLLSRRVRVVSARYPSLSLSLSTSASIPRSRAPPPPISASAL